MTEPTPQSNDDRGNLYQRLHRALKRMNRVIKRGRNEALSYNYVTDADVMEMAREPFLEEGLLLLPSMKIWQVDPSSGNAYVVLANRLINIDNPTEVWDFDMIGAGNDMTKAGMRDKAIPKAITAATKYSLLKTCMLPTGDDPEIAREEEFDFEQILSNKRSPAPPARPQQIPQHIPQQVVQQIPPPQPNGGMTDTDMEVERLVRQATALHSQPQQAPPPPAEDGDPQAQWMRDTRRKVEDARASSEVFALFNDAKDVLRVMQVEKPALYREVHALFRQRKEDLQKEGR